MSYIVKYPEPEHYYSIELLTLKGLFGRSYYPVIRKDGTWIHEFGCSWDDKEQAYEAAVKYVNDLFND